MPFAHPNPLYSRAEVGILACGKCGNPMRLSQIEPAAPGYDVRTFECEKVQFQRAFFSRDLNPTVMLVEINPHLESLLTASLSIPWRNRSMA